MYLLKECNHEYLIMVDINELKKIIDLPFIEKNCGPTMYIQHFIYIDQKGL